MCRTNPVVPNVYSELSKNLIYDIHALRQVRKFLTVPKLLGYSFIDSQFNNVPLIWMFCRKICYSKIEESHHIKPLK